VEFSYNVACSRGPSAVAELLVTSVSCVFVYIVRLYVFYEEGGDNGVSAADVGNAGCLRPVVSSSSS